MKYLIPIALLPLLLGGCIPLKAIFLGGPDGKDIHRAPSTIVAAGQDCFQFHADVSGIGKRIKVNEWGSGLPVFMPLSGLLQEHAVRSLVVIRNDTVLFEGYGQGKSSSDVHASFSIAKSFTSALIGIAIEEGAIGSVRDLVINYVPELKDIAGAESLRIEHLLNMTSGINGTLQNDAIIYYGSDVKKALRHVQFEFAPGTHQAYVNINVQLLGIILNRATKVTPAEYLSQKIWKPLGMCANGLWSRDKKGENLTFCCLGATALDYAKFGRLYLNRGIWNGKSIVSQQWVAKSIARDTTEGSSFGYNYGWHIGEQAYGDFIADGLYKQHIYVHPEKNIIIVLLCDKENALKAERVRWQYVFRQIVDQL